jgi:hypothetical protein
LVHAPPAVGQHHLIGVPLESAPQVSTLPTVEHKLSTTVPSPSGG